MAHGRICSRAGGKICTDCQATCRLDNQRRTAKRKQHGLTLVAWLRLRRRALDRDGNRCQLRYPGCKGNASTVHLHPRLAGDHRLATLPDLMSACDRCHGVIDAPRARRAR